MTHVVVFCRWLLLTCAVMMLGSAAWCVVVAHQGGMAGWPWWVWLVYAALFAWSAWMSVLIWWVEEP